MLPALTKESSVIRLESRHLNIAFTDDAQMQTIPLPLIDRAAWENKRERKFKYAGNPSDYSERRNHSTHRNFIYFDRR